MTLTNADVTSFSDEEATYSRDPDRDVTATSNGISDDLDATTTLGSKTDLTLSGTRFLFIFFQLRVCSHCELLEATVIFVIVCFIELLSIST